MSTEWRRVSRRRPCPVCEKPDWCLYVGDDDSPTAVICARVESEKQCGEGGWLHRLRDDGVLWPKWQSTIHVAEKSLQASASLTEIRAEFTAARIATTRPQVKGLADSLGVSADSLFCGANIAWMPHRKAWGFAMLDSRGDIVGVRLRLPSGKKLSIKGGHEGLFYDVTKLARGKGILIAEGPTDTAALLDLCFRVVGRPSCTGGVKHIVGLVQRLEIAEAVIVADADAPGQRGAGNLASVLLAYVPSVRVITPPAKDAREWKRSGATAADVEALIAATPAKSLKIRVSSSNKSASLCPVG